VPFEARNVIHDFLVNRIDSGLHLVQAQNSRDQFTQHHDKQGEIQDSP
jgi:hypothetical protein